MDVNSPARMIADAVKERLPQLAGEMAKRMGRPLDGEPVPRSEQARLWLVQNPEMDPMQLQTLIAQGAMAQAVDYVYPWRTKLIGPGSPTKRAEKAAALAAQAEQYRMGQMQQTEVPVSG